MKLEQVIEFATKAHGSQTRRDGTTPYTDHLKQVAGMVFGEKAKKIAWLHDVLEDTPVTEQDMLDAGIDPEVVLSVVHMTKEKGESYDDYLAGVRQNDGSIIVKIADMICNLSDEPTQRQKEKYKKGLKFLLHLGVA